MSETCAGCFDDPALGHLFDCPTRIHGLEAERDAYRTALEWIAEVNAMDYEYRRVARSVLAGVVSTREKDK